MATALKAPLPPKTKHNYYNQDDFLSYDRDAGTIVTRQGARALHVTEDFITSLQAGLEAEVGDASGLLMYRIGYAWGVDDMKKFISRMSLEFDSDVQKMGLQLVMEQWWWPLQAMGWGAWEIDFQEKKEQGLIITNLYDSAVAKSLSDVGKPVCHMYAGLLAGAIGTLARKELAGIEIQCYATGASFCRFIIGSTKKIDGVEFWLEEGASASDVLGRL